MRTQRPRHASKVEKEILILSGLSEPDNKVKGLGFGADDYMTKPFDKGEPEAAAPTGAPA